MNKAKRVSQERPGASQWLISHELACSTGDVGSIPGESLVLQSPWKKHVEEEASGFSSRSLLAGGGVLSGEKRPFLLGLSLIDRDSDSIGIEKVCKFGNLGLLETFTNLFASSKVYFDYFATVINIQEIMSF